MPKDIGYSSQLYEGKIIVKRKEINECSYTNN